MFKSEQYIRLRSNLFQELGYGLDYDVEEKIWMKWERNDVEECRKIGFFVRCYLVLSYFHLLG